MIVVDTNALVYAVGSDHPLRESARSLFRRIGEGAAQATTTIDVLQEFVYVFARRRDRAIAVQQAERYVIALTPLLRPGAEELTHGLALFEQHERLDPFDAVLAATSLAHGADAFVSADRAFADVDGLPFVDLGGPELERLLA